ncbi:hypothetical protein M408DRAFT_21103 [Serendipita vermifera MAFF 305830]|uniref:DUF6533 domain-containing protein n=1 Tax=Serendipita vermifera MAFF 305830 TaxID=933852 RepID=A0A0C3BK86_SERVB|nr:hypothetical protein M408DRAFT_21103 [Serendipita vermifera MAFF 305830]
MSILKTLTTSTGDFSGLKRDPTNQSQPFPTGVDWVAIYGAHTNAKRLAVAFLTLVVWDFVITIDDSVKFFWAVRWSVSKILYLVSRYSAMFAVAAIFMKTAMPTPSTEYCTAIRWVEMGSSTALVIAIGFAMISRVHALWNRNTWILTGILFLFFIHAITYIIIMSYTYAKATLVPTNPPFTGCCLIPGFRKTWAIFIPAIAFETTIVSLNLYKSWSMAVQRGFRTPVCTMLCQDGIVYYLVIIGTHIASLACILVPSPLAIPVLGSYPSVAATGIACNRLFTRLQRLLLSKHKGQSGFSTHDPWSSCPPEFTFGSDHIDSHSTTTQEVEMCKTKKRATAHHKTPLRPEIRLTGQMCDRND